MIFTSQNKLLCNLCFSSQNALAEMQMISEQRIQEREKELADLRQATQTLTVSAFCFPNTNFTEGAQSVETARFLIIIHLLGANNTAVYFILYIKCSL